MVRYPAEVNWFPSCGRRPHCRISVNNRMVRYESIQVLHSTEADSKNMPLLGVILNEEKGSINGMYLSCTCYHLEKKLSPQMKVQPVTSQTNHASTAMWSRQAERSSAGSWWKACTDVSPCISWENQRLQLEHMRLQDGIKEPQWMLYSKQLCTG